VKSLEVNKPDELMRDDFARALERNMNPSQKKIFQHLIDPIDVAAYD
jgi:hypothetical protein